MFKFGSTIELFFLQINSSIYFRHNLVGFFTTLLNVLIKSERKKDSLYFTYNYNN